jgi:hypothetical protein
MKFFYLFDVPHLLKSTRNNFFSHNWTIAEGTTDKRNLDSKSILQHKDKPHFFQNSFLLLNVLRQVHDMPQMKRFCVCPIDVSSTAESRYCPATVCPVSVRVKGDKPLQDGRRYGTMYDFKFCACHWRRVSGRTKISCEVGLFFWLNWLITILSQNMVEKFEAWIWYATWLIRFSLKNFGILFNIRSSLKSYILF